MVLYSQCPREGVLWFLWSQYGLRSTCCRVECGSVVGSDANSCRTFRLHLPFDQLNIRVRTSRWEPVWLHLIKVGGILATMSLLTLGLHCGHYHTEGDLRIFWSRWTLRRICRRGRSRSVGGSYVDSLRNSDLIRLSIVSTYTFAHRNWLSCVRQRDSLALYERHQHYQPYSPSIAV